MSESTTIITGPVTGPAPGVNLTGLATDGNANAFTNKPDNTTDSTYELHPAAIFSHDMVLQRRSPTPIFGTGKPGHTVIVTLQEDDTQSPLMLCARNMREGQSLTSQQTPNTQVQPIQTDAVSVFSTIDKQGNWIVMLPALEAGGPYTLTISDRSEITLKYLRVYVGEVWLASGQSNMEFELRNADGAQADLAASADPLLRFYNTPKTGVIDQAAEDRSIWEVSGPQTSGHMSAVAYYFARKLRAELEANVPVGIIDCYIGGTSITSWMSQHTLETCEAGRGYLTRFHEALAGKTDEQFDAETLDWKTRFDAWNDAIAKARAVEPDIDWDTLNERYGTCPWPPPVTPTSQYRPTGPFNTMIKRVAPYGLAGFLWYQGEEDEGHCNSYRELLGLLIDEWRDTWANACHNSQHDTQQAGQHDSQHDTQQAGQHDSQHSVLRNDAYNAYREGNDTCRQSEALPFLIVQLPQWIDKTTAATHTDPLHWPVIRAAQWDAAHTIANVHTIALIDCGEFDNLHPTNKRTPGERLADCALHNVYGRTDIAVDGPELANIWTSNCAINHAINGTNNRANNRVTNRAIIGNEPSSTIAEDSSTHQLTHSQNADDACSAFTVSTCCNTVTLQFTHADGLHFDGTVPGTYGRITNNPLHRDANESGFELTDENGIWHSAEATIIAGLHRSDHDDPDSNHDAHNALCTILVHSPAVAQPTAVRYAWRSWGPASLFNRDGLPAPPFLQQIEKHGETMQ